MVHVVVIPKAFYFYFDVPMLTPIGHRFSSLSFNMLQLIVCQEDKNQQDHKKEDQHQNKLRA